MYIFPILDLNNLIYRLKGQLLSVGLPDDEYVEIREGRCCFKSRLTLTLDTQQFEETVEKARAEQDSVGCVHLFDMANGICIAENCSRRICPRCGIIPI